jgi:hypothetical protein
MCIIMPIVMQSLRRTVSAPELSGMVIAPTVNIIHNPQHVSSIRLYAAL